MVRSFLVLFSAILLSCGGGAEPDAGGGLDAALDDGGAVGGMDAGPDGGGDSDAGEVSDGGSDAGPPTTGLTPVDPPDEPSFPAVIDTLSVAVRTATTSNAGTDDPIELCVADGVCFDLDTPDIDDRQEGLVDVFHFSGLALPRSMVDQVTLRTRSPASSDNDRWTPDCLDLRFDGEPVYCNDAIGPHIGTGGSADEVPSWSDPAGLHEACATCWPQTLTHGPVLGGNTPDSVRVWVRADASRRVGLRMSDASLDAGSPVVAWAVPAPQDDFTHVFEVRGLEPGTEYSYRVEVDGDDTQPTHTVHTARSPDDLSPMRIAFGSCSRQLAQPIFAPLLAEDLDAFHFIGDIHYANSRHHEAHRWRYRLFRGIAERAAFLSEVPTVSSWDDHDFVGNNSNGTCAGRDEALDVFTEYWANPPMGTAGTPGVFYQQRWGAVELFALDCRMYRPDVGDGGRRCEDDPAPPTLDASEGPIGAAQRMWAVDAIAASDATFKLVSCGSQFTLDGSLDSWRAFPEARDAFFDALAARDVEGLVLLSGDIHRSEVRTIARPGSYDVPELTSSPLANTRSGCGGDGSERSFCFNDDSSYLVMHIDPSAADPTLTVRVHDVDGLMRYEETILRSSLMP